MSNDENVSSKSEVRKILNFTKGTDRIVNVIKDEKIEVLLKYQGMVKFNNTSMDHRLRAVNASEHLIVCVTLTVRCLL